MTSTAVSTVVSWPVHVPSMGYLCLALALLAHSSRQSPVLDLGYIGDRDLGNSDVTNLGYTDVRDRQLHEGSRMKRLLKISKQLDKSSDVRVAHVQRGTKLSHDVVEELARGVTLLLEALTEPSTETRHEKDGRWFKQNTKRGSSYKDIVAEVRDKYTVFYKSLVDFTTQLPGQLTDHAPSGLHDVDVLTAILTPTDHVFSDANERLFTEKFFTIQQLLDAVLSLLGPQYGFLQPTAQSWYWDNYLILNVQSSNLKASLNRWQSGAKDDVNTVHVLDAGAGGVNSGVRNDMSIADTLKLGGLINTLNALINSH